MADTWIAVGIAIVTAVTAYLGVHLNMHPADTPFTKTVYKIGSAFCAIGICVLVGWQAHRNSRAQENNSKTQQTLLAELKSIQMHALTTVPTTVARSPTSNPPNKHPAESKPPPVQPKPTVIDQKSSGDCSPNIVGDNNSSTCAPEPKLLATRQLQQQLPNGDWLTTFSVSSNVLVQTGDLRLLCDGPVLKAGISRINPTSLITGTNGANPSNPNEAIYRVGPEMLSPGVPVVMGVYSHTPVHVLSGSLGRQVITLSK